MKQVYPKLIALFITSLLALVATAQTCTPQGDQVSYGSNDTWIGYVYEGVNFDTYKGYVEEGTAGDPDFNEEFGGDYATYNTNGCSVYTENFSVRYKLTKTFANGEYDFTVGGDDGYRMSLDGGATWIINNWSPHSYQTTSATAQLNGTYNIVLEYYEQGGGNIVHFEMHAACLQSDDTNQYGTDNTWRGYIYQGMNFDSYRGLVLEGSAASPNFDQNFGGASYAITYTTATCSIQTQEFSARYRLRKTFTNGAYSLIAGGDDGYRLSLDGGATWVIDNWSDHSYTSTVYTVQLNGTYDMVLEYYQRGGDSRVSFGFTAQGALPVVLSSWNGVVNSGVAQLGWSTSTATNFDHFEIERSADGQSFNKIATVAGKTVNSSLIESYSYTDATASGVAYYRLVMIDKDGSAKYSTVIKLTLGTTAATAKVYPTLVTGGQLFVETGLVQQGTLQLFDLNGRMVLSKTLNGASRAQVWLNNTQAGTYIAQVTADGNMITRAKIIIQ